MHAYLIIGSDSDLIESSLLSLTSKLKAQKYLFTLGQISDMRRLESFASLKIATPTAIVIYDIHNATNETLNAFLKNLEEPQENLFYILVAPSVSQVLPTIVSRCQVIRIKQLPQKVSQETKFFFDKTVGQKMSLISSIKDRDEALTFVQNLIIFLQDKLSNTKDEHNKIAHDLNQANKTLVALNANGNINLQLTNLVIQISN